MIKPQYFYRFCSKKKNDFMSCLLPYLLLGLAGLFVIIGSSTIHAQTVIVNANTNNIPITRVELEVMANTPFLITQTSGAQGVNSNPSPDNVPVNIRRIQHSGVSWLYPISQIPRASNFHPNVGNNNTAASEIQVPLADGTIIQHRVGNSPNLDYFNAIEQVISTPDLRSYWDLGGGALGSPPQTFMHVRFNNPIKNTAKLAITERFGNTPMSFNALDINGNLIPGSSTVSIEGASFPNLYQWDTGVNHAVNIPTQKQWIILFEAAHFNAGSTPIYGFRVNMTTSDGGDGKIILFSESINAIDDFGSFNQNSSGAILNILTNDELNGEPVAANLVNISIINDFPSTPTGGLSLDIATGNVIVQPNTPPGVYQLTYEICEIASPLNCDQAIVTVVNAECKLEDEEYIICPGQVLAGNVSANDNVVSDSPIVYTLFNNPSSGVFNFNPDGTFTYSNATPGTYNFTYQVTVTQINETFTCQGTATIRVVSASCPQNMDVCITASPFALSGAMPPGGNYSGDGVSNGVFNPSVAGVGAHVITYNYQAGTCLTACNFTITVHPLPALALQTTPQSPVCSGASVGFEIITDAPTVHWQASLPGKSGTGKTFSFDPSIMNKGTQPMTINFMITATSEQGCVSTISAPHIILPEPYVIITPQNLTVCFFENVTLTATPSQPGSTISWIAVNNETNLQ